MRKILGGLERVSLYFAMASTFVMMLLATGDAAGRYIFNQPIRGAYEITEQYLMVVAVFLGVGRAYHEGAFIRVTFLVDHLPQRVKVGVKYFVQILSIVIGVAYVICQARQTLRCIATRMTLDVWGVPLWPTYAIASLGLLFVTGALLFDLWGVKTGMSDLFKETTSSDG